MKNKNQHLSLSLHLCGRRTVKTVGSVVEKEARKAIISRCQLLWRMEILKLYFYFIFYQKYFINEVRIFQKHNDINTKIIQMEILKFARDNGGG